MLLLFLLLQDKEFSNTQPMFLVMNVIFQIDKK